MSDPSRLRDDAGTDGFERALLRSATIDREPDDGAARALAAFGIAATAGAVGLAGPSATRAMGTTSSAVSVAGGAVAAKVSGVVLLAAVAITGVVLGLSPSSAPSNVAGAGPSVAPEEPTSIGAAPVAMPESDAVAVADLPSATPERALVPTSHGTSPRRPPVASPRATVSEELALIDQARAAIARGDGAGAEKALDTYEARFPNGSLVLEAKLARIEVLVARSDSAGALDLAERFLREHPRTPYERRVQVLMRRARPDAPSR